MRNYIYILFHQFYWYPLLAYDYDKIVNNISFGGEKLLDNDIRNISLGISQCIPNAHEDLLTPIL